ncbi:hypothetical protein CEXT_221651 [Caerostris extrusa]|uniref:Uncharacterized protein n=1 Tax=Caerostris extrusa TaxID=172846 RepID=A0AAV4RTX6_CAEEX|nr:hypothetical protein CEXT_221651 [Caerostris extrusa]
MHFIQAPFNTALKGSPLVRTLLFKPNGMYFCPTGLTCSHALPHHHNTAALSNFKVWVISCPYSKTQRVCKPSCQQQNYYHKSLSKFFLLCESIISTLESSNSALCNQLVS